MTKNKMLPLKESHKIQKGGTAFAFLESGDLFYALASGCMITGLRGNPMDGSINNIWLRIYKNGSVEKVLPLIGVKSTSLVTFQEDSVIFTGSENAVSWQVTFKLINEFEWLWDVRLDGKGQICDLLYGQDIGVADEGGVLTNELYMAQYLGHTIFTGDNGYTVYSRQNQGCGCGNPCLQQGMCVGTADHYSTDATQFFGLGVKCGEAGLSSCLPDVNYQYELSYTGLQSGIMTLDGTEEAAFYGIFTPDHKDAVRSPENADKIKELQREAKNLPDHKGGSKITRPETGSDFVSRPFTESEIESLFPGRRLEEKSGEKLLSFFWGNHSHVVLREKEEICERPHSVIHMTPVNQDAVDSRVLSSTSHMCGVFLSQTVVGNTSFHKVISTVRNPLNLLHNSGLRLFIRLNGAYSLLTMPSAFEMGISYSRWYYAIDKDILRVTVFVHAGSPSVSLEAESMSGKKYDMLFTSQLLFGENEFTDPVEWAESNGIITISGQKPDAVETYYPDLCYRVSLKGESWNLSDDRVLFEDNKPRNGTLLTMEATGRSHASFTLTGCLYGENEAQLEADFNTEKENCEKAFERLTRGLVLTAGGSEEIQKLNETIWWYSHNAMIHFASPHGIEQPGGAAWGARDICQGPMEYLLAFGHFTLARDVLCHIFSHQFRQNREWPQWFMFDRYPYSAGECHGDVVFWPLKALSDYIERSGDTSILEEVVPYTEYDTNLPGDEAATILSHVSAAVQMVEETRFVGGTALVSYAGGDWDDTLQPANPEMKEKLISSWTVALCYQTFNSLSATLPQPELAAHLKELSIRVKNDFNKYLVKNGVTAGFGVYEDGKIRVMIHPDDDATEVHYRLLPLTRSIIAEMIDQPAAVNNMSIIDKQLKCPDGVRLMDKPVAYDGGVTHMFMRAEQAANVGREISLQYTHAHIRYIEACAKLGLGDEAWKSLFVINPIKITDVVPNARTRQSNLYFSSSEGCFNDRYDYSRGFDRLRDGTIDVKGGWRLYSSGPGIYLNQLISNVLGIRVLKNGVEFNPVLPEILDGLRIEINLFGKPVNLRYHLDKSGLRAEKSGETISAPSSSSPYRCGGCVVKSEDLMGTIDIYL